VKGELLEELIAANGVGNWEDLIQSKGMDMAIWQFQTQGFVIKEEI
jgi:hypothetical protein